MQVKAAVIGLVSLVVGGLRAATYYVDSSRLADDGDGIRWNTAKKTIQAAVDLTVDGDVVWVTNGTYSSFSTGGQAITIRSVGGATATIIDGQSLASCANLGASTNTVLDGFTLQNGRAWYGGGANGGTLKHCVISGNVADGCGGGAYLSNLSHCYLRNNKAGQDGGGVYSGYLSDCLVVGNRSEGCGGGVGFVELYQCTVVGNQAAGAGGGAYWATGFNSIFWGNTCNSADSMSFNFAGGYMEYSCSSPLQDGAGNIGNDPRFVSAEDNDYRLRENSPCLDRGSSNYVFAAEDLEGDARVLGAAVDIGAFEGAVPVTLSAPTNIVASDGLYANKVRISWSAVSNAVRYRVYRSELRSGTIAAVSDWQAALSFDDTPAYSGRTYWYWVKASRDEMGLDKSKLSVGDTGNRAFEAKWFVDARKPNDDGDGRSWATAKQTIQTAVDLAEAGDSIAVAGGVYQPFYTTNKIMSIRGVDGVAATVVDGGGSMCCAYMGDNVGDSAVFLYGMTLQNGNSATGGGGCKGGSLENCVLVGNRGYFGGGACDSTLAKCVISNNWASSGGGAAGSALGSIPSCVLEDCFVFANRADSSGGGLFRCSATGCEIRGNQAYRGGGAAGDEIRWTWPRNCVLTDCVLTNNGAVDGGGGADLCSLSDCRVVQNTAQRGGGIMDCAADRCVLVSNRAFPFDAAMWWNSCGGGACNGTLKDCLITDNSAYSGGGAAVVAASISLVLQNCTVAGNVAVVNGGGIFDQQGYGWSVINSIICGNQSPFEQNYYSMDVSKIGFTNSCSMPLPPGSSNISADPMFVDAARGNYRLMPGSPCIGAGTNTYATSPTDLSGLARIIGGSVDMGAYEYAPLAYVLDCTNAVWTTGGSACWFGDGGTSADDSGAARSGGIGDSQSTWIQAAVEGKGTLQFSWRVSTESGRDFLRVYLDGQPAGALTGDTEWQTCVLPITNIGPHTIRWEYVKGKSGSAGQDAAWLDQVSWQPLMADIVVFVDPAEGGRVAGGGTHVVGSSATLLAVPNRGWRFERWENGETNARRTLVVPEGRCLCTAHFIRNAVSLAEAVDNASQTWSMGGDIPWAGWTLATAHDSEDAAQSGAIGDLGVSSLSTTVTGPGTLSFWWRVSCEENYDYLDFSLDGGVVDWLTGESGWRLVTMALGEGVHRIEWIYSKDESDSGGEDAAWLDQVVWRASGPAITRQPVDVAVAQGESANLTVSATGAEPLRYQWFLGSSGQLTQPVAGATNVAFVTPRATTNTAYWVRVTDARGMADSQTARVRIGYGVGTLADLRKVGTGVDGWTLDAAYRMTNDIDASATATWNDAGSDVGTLEGFAPIGDSAAPFTGTFDGKGHVVRLLTVNRAERECVGLFGCVGSGGCVANMGVIGGRRIGYGRVGGLVGENRGTVMQVFAVGDTEGVWAIGGLVGDNSGWVEDAYAQGTAEGLVEVGGWVGYNGAGLSRGFSSVVVAGEGAVGGLVGENWGTVQDAYWNTEASGLAGSAGGTALTTAQSRQAASFVGWWMNGVWGIQEGVGAPYLTVIAQGRTAHQLVRPVAISPANNTFVWSPRPALTGNVAVAGVDVIDARWQVAKTVSFTNAFDWTGITDLNYDLRTSFDSRVPPSRALEANTMYEWRVRVQCGYGEWTDWSTATKFLVLNTSSYIESGKNKLSTWANNLRSGAWDAEDLKSAGEDFDTAIVLDGEDIESHIYRATTTVLALSENRGLRDLLAAFGFGFDESLLAVTGAWAGVASPLPNAAVDRVAADTLPSVKLALQDLSAVPTNWTGSVEVSSDKFPVDETVHFDVGDVLYARALLNAAQAAILIAQGYDLTADYSKTNRADYATSAPTGRPLDVTLDGDESEWAAVPVALYGEAAQIEYVKIAQSATNVCLLVHLADGIAPYYCFVLSKLAPRDTFFYCGGAEGSIWEQDGRRSVYRGRVLEIVMDLAPEQQGLVFSPDEIDLSYREVTTEEWGWDYAYFEGKSKPIKDLIVNHPALLSAVRGPDKLVKAKSFAVEALKSALAADVAVQSRTDGLMHFFEYDPEQTSEQAELRQRLNEASRSMDAPQHIAWKEIEGDAYLGAFFESPYLTRSLLPGTTDDNEIIGGTFPDPTLAGLLPAMTQATWQQRLAGHVPFAVTNAFTWEGHVFATGGDGSWEPVSEKPGQTNCLRGGASGKVGQSSWVETTIKGPGTLTFSWAVSSRERVDTLSVWVDGVRQTNTVSGEVGWGPRQVVLTAGSHTVRWRYFVSDSSFGYFAVNSGTDAGFLRDFSWSAAESASTTTTPIPVPYAWLDSFSGLVVDGDYEAAAKADPDHDGMSMWQEYLAGTSPTNAASVLQATIRQVGAELVVGWTPDLTPMRVYTVEGKEKLTDPSWGSTNAATHFYRVRVQLP